MPTPFPGMDPYLEYPGLWKEVQTGLAVAIADALGPQVRTRYRVSVERRTYLTALDPDRYKPVHKPDDVPAELSPAQPPGVAKVSTTFGIMPRVAELPVPEKVAERYLQVRDIETGDAVTIIEILSPANKSSLEGRRQYERKRHKVLGSAMHLVEIDLLRTGEPFPCQVSGDSISSDYRIIISRAQHRPRADVYLFGVRDPIPDIPIPLQLGEVEPILRLNQVLHELYDRAGYDLAIDYEQPPDPPLLDKNAQWVSAVVATIYPNQKLQPA